MIFGEHNFTKQMLTFYFKQWEVALAKESLADNLKRSYKYTTLGYLGYLQCQGGLASIHNARTCTREVIQEEQPASWQAQRWKDALNWWFKKPRVSGGTTQQQISILDQTCEKTLPIC